MGLNVYNGNRFRQFRHNPHSPGSLSHNYVHEIFEDSKKRLWIGTSYGFNLYNPAGTFVRFSKKDGLPNEIVKSILEDLHGDLWISTNKGISRFAIRRYFDQESTEGCFQNFDSGDGLQSNEFNPRSCAKSVGGKLYFGGVNGFKLLPS